MRLTWIIAASFVATGAAAANTRFCTQDEKQLANKLHEQNTDPAKSCYRAANGGITTLDTSRLCPLPECATWLAYMAANSPDYYYESTNYAAKSADCIGGASTSSSATASSANLRSSSSGSESPATEDNGTEPNSKSLSVASEDRDLNTTASVSSFSDVPSFDRSDDITESSSHVEVDAPTSASPENSATEGEFASRATDSPNSTTPTPTSSSSSSSLTISSLVILISVSASIGVELLT